MPISDSDLAASHLEAREFRATAGLLARLEGAYHRGSTAAQTAALDQIRAYLAEPGRRVDRTRALFVTAVTHTAGIIRARVSAVALEAKQWRVPDHSGVHLADPQGHYLAAQALAATLNERDPHRLPQEVMAPELELIALGSPALGLAVVTEAVWLSALARGGVRR
jgi:hypothetical protein